ncbi:MAG: hypothetical protein HY905_03360 [Deltaproteobacteria bacterium]|nr:hypothetical protein [Deltaproteobacteria bacterium]
MARTLDAFRTVSLVTLLATAACMDRDLTTMDPVVQAVTTYEVVQPPSGKVDLVVVVDNSRSMQEEQAALVANFPALIDELMAPSDPDHTPVIDLNVAIVSTDMGSAGYQLSTCSEGLWGYDRGDDGCFLHTPRTAGSGCLVDYPGFLRRNPDNAGSYPLSDMGRDFGCMATLGTNGCGFEQQLEAARKGLVDHTLAGDCNAGFLRNDSILAVVVVSDEEDCSVADTHILDPEADAIYGHANIRCYIHPEMLKSVTDMVGQLRGLRGNARDFVMAMIVGVPMGSVCENTGDRVANCLELPEMQYVLDGTGTNIIPVCHHPLGWGAAVPGRRFIQAAQEIGSNALVRSICNEDWRPAMTGILDLIQGALDNVCFPHELALDPVTCRADCNIVELLSDDRSCPAGRVEADPPTETDDRGVIHRRCVILQADRVPAGDGTCPITADAGWYYIPRAQSTAHCDQVFFAPNAVPEPLSSTQLECLSYVCPAERRCGGSSNPGGRCCGTNETCADFDPVAGGRCISL